MKCRNSHVSNSKQRYDCATQSLEMWEFLQITSLYILLEVVYVLAHRGHFSPGLETTFCNVVPVGQAIVEIVRGY